MIVADEKPVKGFVQKSAGEEFVARTPHGQAEGDIEAIPCRGWLVDDAPDGGNVEKSFHITS